MQSHVFLLIWPRIAIIGSFTGNIKLRLFPYVLRVFEEVFFLLFYMVCISSLSDAGCTAEVMNGEEKVPVPVPELTFYFGEYAKFRAERRPKVRPRLPE